MYDIPKPELLDPERIERADRDNFTAEDHRSQSQLLAKALGESCAYADQLWNQVDALRGYLLDILPPDSQAPGVRADRSGAPTGVEDDAAWSRWVEAFGTTTSVLCGAHGDSGFGLSRAREEARLRHSVPVPTVLPATAGPPATTAAVAPAMTRPNVPEAYPTPATTRTSPYLKPLAAGVVGVLALRGLRTAPRTLRPRGDARGADS